MFKRFGVMLAALVMIFSLSGPALANTGSFTWGEYGNVDFHESKGNVEDNDVNGCNCTGTFKSEFVGGGYDLKAYMYDNSNGQKVSLSYYWSTDQHWRAVCKWWQAPDGSWSFATVGSWDDWTTNGECWTPNAGTGSGGSW